MLDETQAVDDVVALEQLRDRLLEKLRRQREHALDFYAWYRCEQDPPDMPPAADYRPAFQRLREMARTAFGRLVVDAIAERLYVQGVDSTVGEPADARAWEMLQNNRIDADQRDVYTEAFIAGVSYVSVAGTDDTVRITPETCLEVTHEAAPGDRRAVLAALKLLPSQSLGGWLVELYTPALVAVWEAVYKDGRRTPLHDGARAPWAGPLIVQNPLGEVPFVPFENRPTAATPGLSELDELIPILQRIQELELAKLIGTYSITFPQKWATGLLVERDADGNPLPPFESGPMRLWAVEDKETKFGAFPAGDIGQYLRAIGDEVGELAAISRVPSYYLVQSDLANPPSAESLIVSETGLVAKCLDRQRSFGESWEQVVRLAAAAVGDSELAADTQLEVVWHTPERRNPAVVADAATKLQAVNVPQEWIWAFLGYSPQAIARMRVDAHAQALAEAALAAPVTVAPAA